MAFAALTSKSAIRIKTHKKSKSTDFDYSRLIDLCEEEGCKNETTIAQSRYVNALLTPPRSKAYKIAMSPKKDKKKQKLPKLKDVPHFETSRELKRQPHVKYNKGSRCHSISSPMIVKQAAVQVALSHRSHSEDKDELSTLEKVSPLSLSDGLERHKQPQQQVASAEHNGKLSVKEKRQSFSSGLQRSCSLDDVLGDEHDFENPEASWRAKELESIHQSRQTAYQRFISHQDHVKKPNRRGHSHQSGKPALDDTLLPHRLIAARRRINITMSISHRWIQRSRNVEDLIELLETNKNVNVIDDLTGDALIHVIMMKKRKQERLEFLLTLLIHREVDVNLKNKKGEAALHMAVENGDEMCAKALVVFGADVNMEGRNCFTPIDLAIDNGTIPKLEEMLINLRAKSSSQLIKRVDSQVLRHHIHKKIRRKPRADYARSSTNDRILDFVNRKNMLRLCRELEANINQRLSFSASIGGDEDNTVLVMQQREVALFNKTLRKSSLYSAAIELEEGSRVLCLDGGGIKGLIQIEVLMQIEAKMKRKITELFDWIVGTSTGGVIALALVYGGKSLRELRQLYFRIKDEIFAKGRYGFGWDSDAYEEILQQYLDPDIKLMDVTHPRVLIAAVNKATTNLDLHFFNNCLGDEFCDYPVWKVARYTSAAPMFLKERDNYVDGGIICNNPTDCGLTVIQNFYRKQERKPPIALVVSVGSGRYPAEKIGKVDAQSFLYFGKQWLQPDKLIKRAQNLLTLLNQALVETEKVAENSKSRCKEQDIPFYRLNPELKEIIPPGETDNAKLLDMLIETKVQIKEQHLKEMIRLLQMITVNSSDVSVMSTPPAARPTRDASFAEKSSPPPSNQKRFLQVPRFTITTEDGEDQDGEDEAKDKHNDLLNESIVNPTEATVHMDNPNSVSIPGAEFLESDCIEEPSSIEFKSSHHRHYRLEVDNKDQQSHQYQSRHAHLETIV